MFEILVIDDDKNTRRLMNAILLGAGYKPVLAEDGEKALEIYNTHHVDMVIADIMMPNLDGYEFTKILRKSNQDIPIIMVSAKELPDDRKKGFKAGIDDYLVKPVDEEECNVCILLCFGNSKLCKTFLADVFTECHFKSFRRICYSYIWH